MDTRGHDVHGGAGWGSGARGEEKDEHMREPHAISGVLLRLEPCFGHCVLCWRYCIGWVEMIGCV